MVTAKLHVSVYAQNDRLERPLEFTVERSTSTNVDEFPEEAWRELYAIIDEATEHLRAQSNEVARTKRASAGGRQ